MDAAKDPSSTARALRRRLLVVLLVLGSVVLGGLGAGVFAVSAPSSPAAVSVAPLVDEGTQATVGAGRRLAWRVAAPLQGRGDAEAVLARGRTGDARFVGAHEAASPLRRGPPVLLI